MEDIDDFERHQGQKSLSGLLQVLHHLQLHPTIRVELPIPNPVSEVIPKEEIESELLDDELEQKLLRQRLEPSIQYPIHAPTDYPYAPTENPFYNPEQARVLTLLSAISTLLSTGSSSSHFSTTLHSIKRHTLLIAKSTVITRSDERWARKLHLLLTDQRPEPRGMRLENKLTYVEQEMFPYIVQRCHRAINKRIGGLRQLLDLDFSKPKGAMKGVVGEVAALSWQERDHLGWEAVKKSSVAIDWMTTLRVSPHLQGRQITQIFKVTHGYLDQWSLENWQVEKFLLGVLFNLAILLNEINFDTIGVFADRRGENSTLDDVDEKTDGLDADRPWTSRWSRLADSERYRIRRFTGLIGYCQILHSSRLLQYLAWNPDEGCGGEHWEDVTNVEEKPNEADRADPHRSKDTAVKTANLSSNLLSPDTQGQTRGKKRKRSPSPFPSHQTTNPPRGRFQNQRRSQRELALKIRRRLWKLMVYVDEVIMLVYRVQQAYPDGQASYYWVGEREGDNGAAAKEKPSDEDNSVEAEETGARVPKNQTVCSTAELAIEDAFWSMQHAIRKDDEPLKKLTTDGKLSLLRESHRNLFENWSPTVPVPPNEIQLHPEVKLMLHLEFHPDWSAYRLEHPLEFRTPIGSSKRTCWCCAVWLCEFWVEGSDRDHRDSDDDEETYESGSEEEENRLPAFSSTSPRCVVGEVRSHADWSWAFPDAKEWTPDVDERGNYGRVQWQRTIHRVIQNTNEFTLEVMREQLRKTIGR
ncbi:hypothetical protein K435DRAFT_415453 [Dendrothele bispora CBS 962.96]|uniref:Uncharacterized protein n=1 Tax=Dendrothele bispora (strain CBS 962.96) TaxID=1314807 RepID=A0A4S8MUH0_DENBC|nr:hypothetical protein K435DRAFT_415453 [Dendrothele bispora CBS 962.96]